MDRRLAPLAALLIALSAGGAVFAAATDPAPQTLESVSWPVSTLLVSEVQTGGSSASDEFAEIANVGTIAVDLAGLELVYVTSTGSTVTRKAAWTTTTMLDPGRHLLFANTSGIYASLADLTYSGGFAATGGAIVLRAIGGAPFDAVGWGDASNGFVEGAPGPAPAAGASIERLPGGLDGNTTDTNSNSTDWFVQSIPNPQSLAAPPVPAPGLSPGSGPSSSPAPTSGGSASPAPTDASETDTPPSPTVEPSSTADPTATVAPTATAIPSASATPQASLEPSPALTPTPAPTPESTPAPTPESPPPPSPSPEPTPGPSATPAPSASAEAAASIIDARALPVGTSVRIVGVLTTHLGALEAGRKAFVQDDTGGIALYLDVAAGGGLPADTLITVIGTVDERFGERTLRANVVDIVALGEQQRPPPWDLRTGDIGELVEGYRVIVQGTTVGSPTTLSDGLGLMVDDGTGEIRVIVAPLAVGGASVPGGTTIVAVGPVGQRDSTGTGLSGYRIHVTEEGDFGIVVPPPSPTPAPTSTPAATPTPSLAPTPAPTPTLTPAPTPAPTITPRPTSTPSPTPSATPGQTAPPTLTVVEARGAPIGTVVTVAGVVTAEAGRLGLPPLIAIADGTGGMVVRLPDGVAPPARGTTVVVKGPLAAPYGQLELRPTRTGIKVTGQGSLPAPLLLIAKDLGEATEGRLAELTGTVAATPRKGANGDLTIDFVDAAGTSFRVLSDGSSEIVATDLVNGRTYELTGIVGQRASRKGTLDGYRLHLRDKADIAAVTSGSAGPSTSGGPATTTPISTVIALPDGSPVTVEATVTAGSALLDASGRRIIVQDASGAIEILLPSGTPAPAVGVKVRLGGTTGHAWGAPRIAATSVDQIAGPPAPTPRNLDRPPAERDEWLLVRISGSILEVERLGDRWRAEIVLANGTRAPVHGQAGAGIPSTAIVVGRRITVTGIVKRPYPTASDRRFAVLPRNGADVAIGPAGDGTGQGSTVSPGSGGGSANSGGDAASDITPDTDLAALLERVGQRVRVGGLVARLAGNGFDLDDGTAVARIELRGDMAALLPHLREGEAIAASGLVELVAGAPIVVVDESGELVRVGSLGQAIPIGGVAADPGPSPNPSGRSATLTADSTPFGPAFAPTSLLALLGISVLSVLATIVRRRLLQRRLRASLVARLAALRTKEG